MAFKMRVIEDSINLQTLISASDQAGDRIMKRCASVIKVRAIKNLKDMQKKHFNKSGYELKRPREVHMADDVVIKTGKDKYGYKYAKVGGGKHTGTLWHILNDGTYRTKATHFMDKTISETEGEIQSIIDEELRRSLDG